MSLQFLSFFSSVKYRHMSSSQVTNTHNGDTIFTNQLLVISGEIMKRFGEGIKSMTSDFCHSQVRVLCN